MRFNAKHKPFTSVIANNNSKSFSVSDYELYIARTSDGTGMGHPARERDLDRNGTRASPGVEEDHQYLCCWWW